MTIKTHDSIKDRIIDILLKLLSEIPSSSEQPSDRPKDRCQAIKRIAAMKAAAIAAGCSIPPGPAGLATIVPDLLLIWQIQQQMVADIAHVYGKQSMLGPEQMIYCLFKHTGAQVVCWLVVKVGNKVLVRRVSLRMVQKILSVIGIKITQRLLGRAISRYFPIVGSVFTGGFAYYDTCKVADTAIELFEQDLDWDGPNDNAEGPGASSADESRCHWGHC